MSMVIAQCGRFGEFTYYSALIPASQLNTVFAGYLEALKKADNLDTMERSQRLIDKPRIAAIRKYLARKYRFFPSILSSFNGEATELLNGEYNIHQLAFAEDPYALDGQHRLVSMVNENDENPEYNDTISVLFIDVQDLDIRQQLFTDVNNTARKTTASLNILYDHVNPTGKLVREITPTSLLESEKSTVSGKSDKLVTPSVMGDVICELLSISSKQLTTTPYSVANKTLEPWKPYLSAFFAHFATIFAREKDKAAYRKISVYPHSVTFMACIKVVKWAKENSIKPDVIVSKLAELEQGDFMSRVNPLWDGRCVLGGKMKKSAEGILLTAVAIAAELKIEPTDSGAKMMVATLEAMDIEVESLI